jgi:hypothetical protein
MEWGMKVWQFCAIAVLLPIFAAAIGFETGHPVGVSWLGGLIEGILLQRYLVVII